MSILVASLVLLSISFSVSGQNLSAYEVVEKNNLPRGILPEGVVNYELDQNTGFFKVYLSSSCEYSIKEYKIKYESVVTGYLRAGGVSDLGGVSAKLLFFWVHISEVYLAGNGIDFDVGITSEEFSVHSLAKSPKCGCGFQC